MSDTLRPFTRQDIRWRVTRPGRIMLWVNVPGVPKMRSTLSVWCEDEAIGRYLETVNGPALRRYVGDLLTPESEHVLEMAELGDPIAMAAVAEGRLVRVRDLDI